MNKILIFFITMLPASVVAQNHCIDPGVQLCPEKFVYDRSSEQRKVFESALERAKASVSPAPGGLKGFLLNIYDTVSVRYRENEQIVAALEKDKKDQLQAHFNKLKESMLSAVQNHPDLPSDIKEKMIAKLNRFRLMTSEEAVRTRFRHFSIICGMEGQKDNSYYSDFDEPIFQAFIVVCPFALVTNTVEQLTWPLLHEMGHSLDDGRIPGFFEDYVKCMSGKTGYDLSQLTDGNYPHSRDLIADYWANTVFFQMEKRPRAVTEGISLICANYRGSSSWRMKAFLMHPRYQSAFNCPVRSACSFRPTTDTPARSGSQ